MITRRNRSGMIPYPVFSADSIGFDIPWEDIVVLVSYIARNLFKTSNSAKLYENDLFGYTREEIVSLCNLPLYPVNEPTNIIKLDRSDLYNNKIVASMIKHGNRHMFLEHKDAFIVVLRDIEIHEDYRLANPGYRIVTSLSSDGRFILSVIHDVDAPKNTDNLVKLAGEIAEWVIQSFLIYSGVHLYYNSPDFNIYSDLDNSSVYTSTATIVLKDFPTIKDILFEFDYIRTIYCSIMRVTKETVDIFPSVYRVIDAYFTQIVTDLGEWSLTKDEFKELFDDKKYSDPDYKKHWTELSVDYAIKKTSEIYLNTPAE